MFGDIGRFLMRIIGLTMILGGLGLPAKDGLPR